MRPLRESDIFGENVILQKNEEDNDDTINDDIKNKNQKIKKYRMQKEFGAKKFIKP